MSEFCPNCGADISAKVYALEPDEDDVIDNAHWGRHPSYEEEGECPQCHGKFTVSFDTMVSVDVSVAEITIEDPADIPPKVIEDFFKKTPAEYSFPHDLKCEHCRAHLSIKDKSAKEVMERGMRVAMEFPIPRVTCQKCNPVKV